jgi:hypothetical protein
VAGSARTGVVRGALHRIATAAFAMLALAGVAAAETPLFSESTEQPVAIEGPIDTLVRQAPHKVAPYPAVLSLADGPRFDLQITARGMFRRVSGSCEFPPLRLTFRPEQVQRTLFQGLDELKLVTQCRRNYEHLIALEYTVYRLFNVLTPYSFRTRPLRVTYRDTEDHRQEETQLNFLIEPIEEVARRNHKAVVELQSGAFDSTQLDPRSTAVVAVFAYMIGNLDWDLLHIAKGRSCCHNIKHVAAMGSSTEGIIPVPYDFDQSGFVNAPYATPSPRFKVRSVRERVYRGYCSYNDQLPAVRDLFRQHQDALFAIIDGETRLSPERRTLARQYIEKFYAIVNDAGEWNRAVVEHCMVPAPKRSR